MTIREILEDYRQQILTLKKENAALKKKLAEKPQVIEKIVEKIVEVPVERKVEVVCPDGKVYYSEPEPDTITLVKSESEEMLDELPITKPKRSRKKKEEPIVEE